MIFDGWRKFGPISRLHSLIVWIHLSQLAIDYMGNIQGEADCLGSLM